MPLTPLIIMLKINSWIQCKVLQIKLKVLQPKIKLKVLNNNAQVGQNVPVQPAQQAPAQPVPAGPGVPAPQVFY